MAMILQVIFAVCCFIEIISAGPIPSPNNTTVSERELRRLNWTLTDACGKITAMTKSGKYCGRISKVTFFDNSKENTTEEMCAKNRSIFAEVSCALKNIIHNNCNNSVIITALQKDVNALNRGHNVTCNRQDKMTVMDNFCLKLKEYVNRLQDKCPSINKPLLA